MSEFLELSSPHHLAYYGGYQEVRYQICGLWFAVSFDRIRPISFVVIIHEPYCSESEVKT